MIPTRNNESQGTVTNKYHDRPGGAGSVQIKEKRKEEGN